MRNRDTRGGDYEEMRTKFRPSHADYTYQAKYGVRAWRGGGRASARETVGRVAGGAVARQVLAGAGVEIVAWVERVGSITSEVDATAVRRDEVEATNVRCPDTDAAARLTAAIAAARKDGDSLGGLLQVVERGLPVWPGAPVFDTLDTPPPQATLSRPAA